MDAAADLGTIAAEGRSILDCVRRDPRRSVPQYPTWTLLDLAGHVAAVHARTATVCRTLSREPVSMPRAPHGMDAVTWAEATLAALLVALAEADPDAPCWGFGLQPSPRSWLRRMVIETGLHRWDAESSFGPAAPLSPRVAAHGLDEFDEMYLPRLGALPSITVVATDLGRTWRLGAGTDPEIVVEATASDLYLRLMSRPGARLPSAWADAVDALAGPAG